MLRQLDGAWKCYRCKYFQVAVVETQNGFWISRCFRQMVARPSSSLNSRRSFSLSTPNQYELNNNMRSQPRQKVYYYRHKDNESHPGSREHESSYKGFANSKRGLPPALYVREDEMRPRGLIHITRRSRKREREAKQQSGSLLENQIKNPQTTEIPNKKEIDTEDTRQRNELIAHINKVLDKEVQRRLDVATQAPEIAFRREARADDVVMEGDLPLEKQFAFLPGDLVHVIDFVTPGCAVVVNPNKDGYILIAAQNGSVYTTPSSRIMFHAPGVFKADQEVFNAVEKAFNSGTLEGASEQSIEYRLEMSRTARKMRSAIKDFIQAHLYEFSRIYDVFAPEDPTMARTISCLEVAQQLFGKKNPDTVEVMATWETIFRQPTKFAPDPYNMRESQKYTVMPRQLVRDVEDVMKWCRSRSPEIQNFLKKAMAITYELSHQKVDANLDPRMHLLKTLPEFTESDRSIIRFLRLSSLYLYSHPLSAEYEGLAFSIIKEVSPYYANRDLDETLIRNFLSDIGVNAQWESPLYFASPIPLPGRETSRQALQLAEKADSLAESAIVKAPKVPPMDSEKTLGSVMKPIVDLTSMGPNDFYERDQMESIRHDFGNLPAYAIDDVGASEIDDAVSIEIKRGADGNDRLWVYVHVADPTAIIPPTNTLANIAGLRNQTLYLPEKHYPMIPSVLAKKYMSLNSTHDANGVFTLTFGYEVDGNTGEMVDIKVMPGIVRNMKTANYNAVDQFLPRGRALKLPIGYKRWSFAYPNPMKEVARVEGSASALNDQDLENLSLLQKISDKHYFKRVRSGAVNTLDGSMSVTVEPFPLEPTPPEMESPIFWQGHPKVLLEESNMYASPSRLMVSELMIMAGIACSRFSSQVLPGGRFLAMPFRQQMPPSAHSTESQMVLEVLQQFVKDSIDPNTGLTSYKAWRRVQDVWRRSLITSAPRVLDDFGRVWTGHWGMGLSEAYVRCTSPLRRYEDMLAHWQIKHVLLHQKPLFDEAQMRELISSTSERERFLKRTQREIERFWAYYVLHKRSCKESGLLNDNPSRWVLRDQEFPAWKVAGSQYRLKVNGMSVIADKSAITEALEIGEEVIVRISSVNMNRRSLEGQYVRTL